MNDEGGEEAIIAPSLHPSSYAKATSKKEIEKKFEKIALYDLYGRLWTISRNDTAKPGPKFPRNILTNFKFLRGKMVILVPRFRVQL